MYAFVIMPKHEYFIWEQINKNGKETAQGSFLKYTTHEFLKNLKEIGESEKYEVKAFNKKHEIWQRDILSVTIYNREVVSQKLEYIHFNSVRGNWSLSKYDLDYYYSSARFYETIIYEFGFLNNLYVVFNGE